MKDAVGDRALKRLPHIGLNFIDGSISRYCSIFNLTEKLEHINEVNKLASVQCDLESDCTREKEENKKREMEAEKD